MTKAVKKYLLTLSLFLLSGYGFMYASSSQSYDAYAPFKISDKSTYSTFIAPLKGQHLTPGHANVSDVKKKEGCKVYTEKNEEEDKTSRFFSLKKYPAVSHPFITFYAYLFEVLSYRITGHLLAIHPFIHTCLHRYILLRVIRI